MLSVEVNPNVTVVTSLQEIIGKLSSVNIKHFVGKANRDFKIRYGEMLLRLLWL